MFLSKGKPQFLLAFPPPSFHLSELVKLYFSSGLFLRLAGWLHCNLITSESTEGKYQAIYGERLWSSRLFIKWALVALGVAVVTSPLIPTPWGRETQVEKSTFWSMPAGGWQNPYMKTGQDGGCLAPPETPGFFLEEQRFINTEQLPFLSRKELPPPLIEQVVGGSVGLEGNWLGSYPSSASFKVGMLQGFPLPQSPHL